MICKLKLLISINKHLYRGMYEYIGFFQLRILTQDKRVRITPILYIHWFVIADSPTYVWHFVNENVKTGKPLRQKKDICYIRVVLKIQFFCMFILHECNVLMILNSTFGTIQITFNKRYIFLKS